MLQLAIIQELWLEIIASIAQDFSNITVTASGPAIKKSQANFNTKLNVFSATGLDTIRPLIINELSKFKVNQFIEGLKDENTCKKIIYEDSIVASRQSKLLLPSLEYLKTYLNILKIQNAIIFSPNLPLRVIREILIPLKHVNKNLKLIIESETDTVNLPGDVANFIDLFIVKLNNRNNIRNVFSSIPYSNEAQAIIYNKEYCFLKLKEQADLLAFMSPKELYKDKDQFILTLCESFINGEFLNTKLTSLINE